MNHHTDKQRHRLRSAVVGALLYLMTGGQSAAASCDATLSPFPGSQLGYRPLTNRCEGFYVSNVSSGSLEVVSLIQGRLNYEWRPDVVLEVSAPPASSQPINVRAVAIPLKTYYRMDGELPPGGKLVWPIRDILYPGKLTADRIGIFGWIGDTGDRQFVPVRVRQIAPMADPASTETDSAHLVVRSSVDVDSILWRMSESPDERCQAFGRWQEVPQAPRHAGAPVLIRVPETADQTAGICLEVAAKERRSEDWLKLSIRIRTPKRL